MDLRTKLVFALVAVSLGSMLALGGFTYGSVRTMLEKTGLEQLDGIAESKKESVEKLFSGWHERVQLIASRTQLRLSLRDWARTHSPDVPVRIRRILSDALRSVNTVESLTVFDTAGHPVAWVVRRRGSGIDDRTPVPPPPGQLSEYRGIRFDAAGEPRLVFVADLVLDSVHLGVLRATLNANDLIGVISNYEGLGTTGETLIVARDESGAIRVIHPVRHRKGLAPGPLRLDNPNDPAALALSGDTSRMSETATDYRGERVRAAYRYLPDVKWGLVVKRDEAELRAPIVEFRNQLTQLGITLAAFAILVGTLLGLTFARPIHELAVVASRIRDGDLAARAPDTREDEIGVLARAFNGMATELEQQVSELREFNRYFELSLDMLCIAGMDGYFKKTNPAFERVLGWSAEQLRSKPFYDLVHPDDVEATRREVDKLAQGIPTIRFENRYRHADGSYRHLMWTAHPDPATGLLYSAAHDITELKETQAQWEAAFIALPAAIVGIDVRGTIKRATAAANTMLGYENGSLNGLTLSDLIREEGGAETTADKAFATWADRDVAATATRRDGSGIEVTVRLHPIGGDGPTVAFVSIVDRTASLEAADRIRGLARELEVLRTRLRTDA